MFYNKQIAIANGDEIDDTLYGEIYVVCDDSPSDALMVPTDEEMEKINWRTAALWSAYLNTEIYEDDVQAMLDLVEVAAKKVLQ